MTVVPVWSFHTLRLVVSASLCVLLGMDYWRCFLGPAYIPLQTIHRNWHHSQFLPTPLPLACPVMGEKKVRKQCLIFGRHNRCLHLFPKSRAVTLVANDYLSIICTSWLRTHHWLQVSTESQEKYRSILWHTFTYPSRENAIHLLMTKTWKWRSSDIQILTNPAK